MLQCASRMSEPKHMCYYKKKFKLMIDVVISEDTSTDEEEANAFL